MPKKRNSSFYAKINEHITVYVEEAKKRDIGRNIIRIDPKTMKDLNIRVGDVIGLYGNKESAGIAWTGYPKDNDLGIIRIDSRLMKNTGTKVGDKIQISKADVKVAIRVDLAPIEGKILLNPKLESLIKRKFNNYPITIDDIIVINIELNQEIVFKIINLEPEGICIIKKESILHFQENISKGK